MIAVRQMWRPVLKLLVFSAMVSQSSASISVFYGEPVNYLAWAGLLFTNLYLFHTGLLWMDQRYAKEGDPREAYDPKAAEKEDLFFGAYSRRLEKYVQPSKRPLVLDILILFCFLVLDGVVTFLVHGGDLGGGNLPIGLYFVVIYGGIVLLADGILLRFKALRFLLGGKKALQTTSQAV